MNTGRASDFTDPFFSPSSLKFPDTMDTALDLSLFLYNRQPTFARASQRLYGHWITELE